jgi:hypothetical protein
MYYVINMQVLGHHRHGHLLRLNIKSILKA